MLSLSAIRRFPGLLVLKTAALMLLGGCAAALPDPRQWVRVRDTLPMRVALLADTPKAYNWLPLLRLMERRGTMRFTLMGSVQRWGDWVHSRDWEKNRDRELGKTLRRDLLQAQLHWLGGTAAGPGKRRLPYSWAKERPRPWDAIWVWEPPREPRVLKALGRQVRRGVPLIYSVSSELHREKPLGSKSATSFLPARALGRMRFRLPLRERDKPLRTLGHPAFLGIPVRQCLAGTFASLLAPFSRGARTLLERPGLGPIAVLGHHGKGRVLLLEERNIYSVWPLWSVRRRALGGGKDYTALAYFGGFSPGNALPDPYQAGLELRMRFYEQASYWLRHGAKAYPAMVEIAARPERLTPGDTLRARLRVRSFSAPPRIKLILQLIDERGRSQWLSRKLLEVPRGKAAEADFEVKTGERWAPGVYRLLAYAAHRRQALVYHQALQYIEVRPPLKMVLKTDRKAYRRGERAQIRAEITNPRQGIAGTGAGFRAALSGNKPHPSPGARQARLFRWIEDWRGRLRAWRKDVVNLERPAPPPFTWAFNDGAPDMHTLWARAALLSKGRILAQGGCPLYRHGRRTLRERLVTSLWHPMGTNGGSTFDPAVQRLFRHAGFNGLGMTGGPLNVYWAERSGFSAYIEAFDGRIDIDGWGGGLRQRVKRQIHGYLKRQMGGDLNTSVIDILSHGEEPGYGHGWGITYHWKGPAAPEKVNRPFRAFLKEHYSSLPRLNREWGSAFSSWSQVRLTRRHSPRQGKALAHIPMAILRPQVVKTGQGAGRSAARFVDTAQFYPWYFHRLVRERRRQLTLLNPTPRHAISTGDYPWLHAFAAMDTPSPVTHWLYSKELLPSQILRALRYQGEDSPAFHVVWGFFDNPRKLGQIVWQYLANQTSHINFWYSFRLMLNPDLSLTKAALWLRRLTDRLRPVERAFLDARRALDQEVALYVPEMLLPGSMGRMDPGRWRNFYSVHLMPDIITLSALLESGHIPPYIGEKGLEGRRLVFAPFAQFIDNSRARSLRRFVERGGVLVTTPGLATHNRHGKLHGTYPGAGLHRLLGFRLTAAQGPGKREPVILSHSRLPFPPGLEIRSYNRDQVHDIAKDVEVLSRYRDGTPALLLRKVGRGKVLHGNFVFDWNHHWRTLATAPRESYRKYVAALCRWAKVQEPPLLLEKEDGAGVAEWGWYRYTGPRRVIQYLMAFSDWHAPRLTVRLKARKGLTVVHDLLGGRPLARAGKARAGYRNGGNPENGQGWRLTLEPGGGTILAVLPYRLARIEATPRRVRIPAGQELVMDIRLIDHLGRPASGAHPLHIDFWDPLGRPAPALGVQRSLAGQGVVRIPTALNDPPGTYRLMVRDAATGTRVEARVELTRAENPPPGLVLRRSGKQPSPTRRGRPRPLEGADFLRTLKRLSALYLGREGPAAKRRLSYFTWDLLDFQGEHRHELTQRLAETDWLSQVRALRKALDKGAVLVLAGEDLGRDPRSGVKLNPFFKARELASLQAVLQAGQVHICRKNPALLMARAGKGRLILYRSSADASGYKDAHFLNWQRALKGWLKRCGFLPGERPESVAHRRTGRGQENSGGPSGRRASSRVVKGLNLRSWFLSKVISAP